MNTKSTHHAIVVSLILTGFLSTYRVALACEEEEADHGTAKTAETLTPAAGPTPGHSDKSAATESVWMRIKLSRSEGILEALARADFEALERNAEVMKKFGRLERWARVKDDDYQMQLRSFDQANLELVRQSRAKNLEGATLAFFQLTNSCVSCHRVVRDREELFKGKSEHFTHVVQVATEYYLNGPQQARPADGTLASGTLVAVVEDAGSYVVVLTEDGIRAFVSTASLKEIDVDAIQGQK